MGRVPEKKEEKEDTEAVVARIKLSETRIKGSTTEANGILELQKLLQKSEVAAIRQAALNSLRRLFIYWIDNGDLRAAQRKKRKTLTEGVEEDAEAGGDSPLEKFRSWLWSQASKYFDYLLRLLDSQDTHLQVLSLRTLMEFVAREGDLKGFEDKRFGNETFSRVVKKLLITSHLKGELLSVFKGEYVAPYADVRHYLLANIHSLIETKRRSMQNKSLQAGAEGPSELDKCSPEDFSTNAFDLLTCVKPQQYFLSLDTLLVDVGDSLRPRLARVSEEEESEESSDEDTGGKRKASELDHGDRHTAFNSKSVKKAFSAAWVALLRLPLAKEVYRKILLRLPEKVIPFMSQPILLSDFLTDSYNLGGADSLLALNGLFVLITEHNLDYPKFYDKLYSLLEPSVLHAQYRARFFYLLDLFLSSSHLPIYVVAAFVKKLSRMSLTAPPAALLFIMPFASNQLLRHPELRILIHRTGERNTDSTGRDPFRPELLDMAKCGALDSSLWELHTMKSHYNPAVATMGAAFEEKIEKQPKYELSEFVDFTYKVLFDQQISAKEKKGPPLNFRAPTGLFDEEDVFSSAFSMK